MEGVSYYLLRCCKKRMKLTQSETSDGIMFPTGSSTVFKFVYVVSIYHIYIFNIEEHIVRV